MDSLQISSSPFLSLAFFVFFLLFKIPPSLCNYDLYKSCSNSFTCGKIHAGYPFWGNSRPADCGHPELKLDCENDAATISIKKVKYRVLDVKPDRQVLKLARDDYMRDICLKQFLNTTFDSALFDYGAGYQNLTLLYGCSPSNAPIPGKFKCPIGGVDYDGYMEMGTHGPGLCNFSVVVPIDPVFNVIDTGSFSRAIGEGFEVSWKVRNAEDCKECIKLAGVCGFNRNSSQTICFCQNQPSESRSCNSTPAARVEPPTAAPEAKKKLSITLGTALAGAGLTGIIVGCWIFYCIQRRKDAAAKSKSVALSSTVPSTNDVPAATNFSRSTRSYQSSKYDLEKGSTYFGVHVFSYNELEEATGNFDSSRELGEGGFGTVYYGKLQDGCVVAVKRLYENTFKRVEQFMNEVEILTRLQHENLVKLYGCTSKRSRELLLVYEYIPNGTVADHLHGNRAKSGLVSWPVRLSIAIETADALAYLHRSDIIHRDVKTNNILLDNNFRVKVADFGLSRLFPTDVTHVSTAPQGTPGYVDPEYYQCYQLTTKSDVYSFGVVLIELISSKQAVDTNRHRHDINLANMAINKIQNHTLHELVDPSLGFEKDNTVRRMTTLVAELAFQCLQQERDMRPSMEEVLKILRGIQSEEVDTQKAEVVDIRVEDVGQLRLLPPPLSPDSVATEKWASDSALPHSF